LARYERQMRYEPLGEEGQRRLASGCALICGCGALGSVLANTLARAGVGKLRIVDRDVLELNNLQRQVLYDERDVAQGLPKAIAARHRLLEVNSEICVEAVVADVNAANVADLLDGVDLVLDGTDNFETRFLLNDACVQQQLPWVYGGCLGAEGQTMTIVPGRTPCLRCVVRESPPPGTTPTCDTAGILAPIVNVVASIQACEALKILSGRIEAIQPALLVIDLWENRLRQVNLDGLREAGDCPCCARREFPWLEGGRGAQTAILCGRNAVQLSFPGHAGLSLAALEQQLRGVGRLARNPFLLRLAVGKYELTVFPDGRTIVAGTADVAEARSLHARYVGS